MISNNTKAYMEMVQKQDLRNLARLGGFQFTDTFFPYTSGEIGPYFVQSVVIEKDGEAYSTAINNLKVMITNVLLDNAYEADVISGGESRDWDFSNPVAVAMEKPHFKIYKEGKVLGADVKDKRVVHVADLSNEGSSPRDLWVPAIKKAGGNIEYIFFFVDRMEDGVQEMQKLGLQSYASVPLDDKAWELLQRWDVIDSTVYSSLMDRMKDKNSWAREMLRSDAGLETLANLFRNPKTAAKGKKVLEKGYPDMREELTDRLVRLGVEV